jgi:hypothetical protein
MLNSFDAVAQYRAIKVSVNVDFIKSSPYTSDRALLDLFFYFCLMVFS